MSTYNKSDLIRHLQQLTPSGFKMDSEGFYTKTESDRIIKFYFGYQEYFPHGVNFNGIGLSIRFNQVENIMHQVALNTSFAIAKATDTYTFDKGFGENVLSVNGLESLYDVEVNDEASFNQVRSKLVQLMDAAILFLNQHPNLIDYYNFGETLSPEKKAIFYQTPPASMLIVNKLLNMPYTSMANQVIAAFSADNEIEEANYYQALKTYLDNL